MPDPEPIHDRSSAERVDPTRRRGYSKPLMFVGLVAVAVVLWIALRDYLDLEFLSQKEAELRAFQSQHPWMVYGIAFALYVLVTGLSLPGAAPLSLLYAWYFGFFPGVILVSFASTTGATIAFLLSRHFFRDAVISRFGDRLKSFNEHLREDGAFYLLWLRLVPLFPFFVINLVMGLTLLPTRTFWWVSQLGMLPGTMVYVYAGSRVPSLGQLAEQGISSILTPSQLGQLAFAFALLGAFPLIIKHLLGRRRWHGDPRSD
jgi:uncharacterized membrane protein YdjX (TVP38/TMEM64 family)